MCVVSTEPFPENRVPRRGLHAVAPDDPDYARLCREQGLEHLLDDANSPLLPNGVHPSPRSVASGLPSQGPNGLSSPLANQQSTIINGGEHHPISPSSDLGAARSVPVLNGVNGTAGAGDD
jgi:hypothetical protein